MGVYSGPTDSWINSSFSNSLNGLVTDGLVLALDSGRALSYPGSGTTWTDLSGNSNNGTLVNGVAYDSSNRGFLVFDGVNDHVTLNSALNLSTNSGFTMCLFLQSITQSNTGWNYFYSRLSPSFEIGTFGTSGNSFIFKDVAVNADVVSANISSSWSYIAFGTNPTTRTPFMHTFNSSGYSLATSSTAFSNTTLGFERLCITGTGGGPGGTQYYGARFANISAYNRVLTLEEIEKNHLVLKSRFR